MERVVVDDDGGGCVKWEGIFVDESDDFGNDDGERVHVSTSTSSEKVLLLLDTPNFATAVADDDDDDHVDNKDELPKKASSNGTSNFSGAHHVDEEEHASKKRRKYNPGTAAGSTSTATTRTKPLQTRFEQDPRYSRWFRMVSSRAKEPESFLCLHCSEVCSGGEALRSHMVYNHVLEYCPSGKLKRGVSAPEVESGLRLLLLKCGKAGWNRNFGCVYCWKQFPNVVQQREHLLQSHWKQVMDSREEALRLERDKKKHGKKSQFKRGLATSPCDHCGLICTSGRRLRLHQVCRHPAQFFFKELLQAELVATTDDDFEKAYQLTMINKSGLSVAEALSGYDHECPVCSAKTGHHARFHLLTHHLPVVISNLKVFQRATATSSASMPTVTTSVQDELASSEEEEEEEEYTTPKVETEEEVPSPPPDIKTEPVTEEVVTSPPPPPEYILPDQKVDIKQEPASIPDYFGDSNAPPTCPHCSKKYFNFRDLDRHLTSVHSFLYYSGLVPPDTSRLVLRAALDNLYGKKKKRNRKEGLQCVHCDFWSERRFTMIIHLREHAGEVVEQVEVQSKSIGRLEVALVKNPNNCPLCTAKFFTKPQVVFHLKEKHSIPFFANVSKNC